MAPPTKPFEGATKLTPEQLAAAASGGMTATEKGELTPAQMAAAAYELQRPRVPANESIWSSVEGEGGRTNIRNANPDLDYRTLDTSLYPADGRQLYAERQKLTDRGYEPISGPLYKGAPRREFIGVATVELWARPIELANEEFRVRIARSCLSEQYANYYWRRCCAEDAPEKRWLPEPLEYAMLVHHGLQPDTKALMTRPGVGRDLARERTIITNLARKVDVHPRGSAPDPVREAFASMGKG
jgi:hypothetical protein